MNESESAGQKVDPATWLDEYGDYLFRFAMSRLRDNDSAEEAVQETFVSALKNADNIPDEEPSGRGCWVS